ncbi:MAG: preprotein translocase subunit SecG [Devosiaceae bacterium]|nr:preprotein translocase subunit SecG [Devosiaceae bacterium]
MANILIVVYLLIVLAMIVVILLQRSEGGALGMGGGNSGGFAPVRTSANLLTRTTAILGALFMATAIGLSIVNDVERGTNSILENLEQQSQGENVNVLDALNSLSGENGLETEPNPNSQQIDAPNLALPPASGAPPAPTNN